METIYFCLPGDTFTGRFLECYTNLLVYALRSQLEIYVRRKYTSNVFLARNLLLKDTEPGSKKEMQEIHSKNTLPFEGRDYDYMFWIDSDMVFLPKHFKQLLDHKEPIVSGIAICGEEGRVNCGYWNDDGTLHFYDINELLELDRDEKGLIDVDFVGFSWLCVQKGVFESIDYPWFRPTKINRNGTVHFPSEDLGWCLLAKEQGWQVKVDPKVMIGHEKNLVLHPAVAVKDKELLKV